jgi:hypothetical protein
MTGTGQMRGEVCSDQQTHENLHPPIFRTATPLLLRGSVFPAFRSSAHYFYDFSTSAIRIRIEKKALKFLTLKALKLKTYFDTKCTPCHLSVKMFGNR